ncbi:ArnT family glycosyltransferase [Halomarina rubra]|uniref:ArnT family glycosyltransferase n=1 Tax=Halomarina rubra TaxID=2071873 RepID=A0ABD6AQK7_9EURY|nr:glycosyltransferase family 39 protein [Halomarina rubra]
MSTGRDGGVVVDRTELLDDLETTTQFWYAAILAVGLFGPFVYLTRPMHVDESTFLVLGEAILNGATPYVDLVDHKPPGVFAVGALLAWLPGESYVAARLLVGALHLVSAVLVVALGTRLRDRLTGLVAGLLFLVGVYLPHFDGYYFMTEPFCLVALLVAALALFSERQGTDALAGVALAVGVLFNQTVFLAGLVVVAATLFALRRPENRTREFATTTTWRYLSIGVPFVTVLALTLALAAVGGFLDGLLSYAVFVPLTDYSTPFDLGGHLLAGASYLPVWTFAAATVAVLAGRELTGTRVDDRLWFVVFWLVILGYPGAVGFSGDHKLLFAFPAAALLAAVGTVWVYEHVVIDVFVDDETVDSWAVVGMLAACVVFVCGIALAANGVYGVTMADEHVGQQEASAAALSEHVDGEAYMLPFNNDVVYFSDTIEPASTFVGLPYSEALADRVTSDLAAQATPYVVVPEGHLNDDGTIAADTGYFPETKGQINAYVEAHYEQTVTAGGYVVFERTD